MTLERHDRLPLVLVALLALICLATAWAPPAGRQSWALEVVPGLLMVLALAILHRKMPMCALTQVAIFVHVLILVYGGYYTYALTPLGNWARDTWHLSRNHYDRVGHLALGLFPALLAREVLLRRTPLQRGGWLAFLTFCVVFAFGAFWELLEWWVTLIVAGDVGTAFLGTQGDEWDAQWDMALVGLGAILTLSFAQRLHDRSMQCLDAMRAESPQAAHPNLE